MSDAVIFSSPILHCSFLYILLKRVLFFLQENHLTTYILQWSKMPSEQIKNLEKIVCSYLNDTCELSSKD